MADTYEPSTQPELLLTADLRERIVAHLRAVLPNEGVCLLATTSLPGSDRETRRVVQMFPGTNTDASPTRFTMAPLEVAAALREIAQQGWELGVIVHSHPVGPPTLSATDLRERYYPEAWHIIISFKQIEPELAAWSVRKRSGAPEIVPVRIVLGQIDGASEMTMT